MCVHITNAMCDICTHGTVLILQKMIECPFLVNRNTLLCSGYTSERAFSLCKRGERSLSKSIGMLFPQGT